MEEFGQWLRSQRMKGELSTRQLAIACGVSPSYMSQVERGHIKKPSLAIARNIMSVLKIEDPEKILMQYEIIGRDDTFISNEDYDTKRSDLFELIINDLTKMDIEQLEAINLSLSFKYQAMFLKISAIEKSSVNLNTKLPMNSIKEYIDFIHEKYVVHRLRRLFDIEES